MLFTYANLRTNLRSRIRRFIGDDSGATAIEYGLIAAGIAIAIMAAIFLIGTKLTNMFDSVGTQLT